MWWALFEATDFDWVITVPAIWRARGKQMMREAGYKVHNNIYLSGSSKIQDIHSQLKWVRLTPSG